MAYELPDYMQAPGTGYRSMNIGFAPNSFNQQNMPAPGGSILDQNKDGLVKPVNRFASGLEALSSGVNAYTGYKTLQLGQDQFDQSKLQYNRDLANQTQVYNTQLEAGARAGYGDSGKFAGANNGEFEAALAAYTKANSVNGKAL